MEQNTFRGFDSNYLSLLKPHQHIASRDFQNLFCEIKECYKINTKITQDQNDYNFGQPSVSSINKQFYQLLITKVFEVNKNQTTFEVVFLFICYLIQHMDSTECHIKTKYLAKIYIDLYLRSDQQQSEKTYYLLAFSAMSLAIKFNESFVYPLDIFYEQQDGEFYLSELFNFQIKLLEVLKFKLNYMTPFTYLDILRAHVPQKQGSEIYNGIEIFIQFCAFDIRLIGCECIHIFLGSLAAFVQESIDQRFHHLLSKVLSFSSIVPYICQVVKQQINEPDLQIIVNQLRTNDISI